MKEVIIAILAILFLCILMLKDYYRYKNFRKKKFGDSIILLSMLIYAVVYLGLHYPLLKNNFFWVMGGLMVGELIALYPGIAAIQRREYTLFRGGAHGKGEGIKWLGLIWIIVSIAWMVFV